MKLACFSDTNGMHNNLQIREDTDVAIFCGDFSVSGNLSDTVDFLSWYGEQPAKRKVLVAGEKDLLVEAEPQLFRDFCEKKGIIYLEDDMYVYEGKRFYGTPRSLSLTKGAFTYNEATLDKFFSRIPKEVDILISHYPANGILDRDKGLTIGSTSLKDKIQKIKPTLFIFGHNPTNGFSAFDVSRKDKVFCYNVSISGKNNINDITYISLLA